jgi:hypothetical protein
MLDPKLVMMLAIGTLLLVSGIIDASRQRDEETDGGL